MIKPWSLCLFIVVDVGCEDEEPGIYFVNTTAPYDDTRQIYEIALNTPFTVTCAYRDINVQNYDAAVSSP